MNTSGYMRYWIILTLAITLAGAYAWKNRLYDRFLEHRDARRQLQEFRQQVGGMHERLETSRARVNELNSNPVENEAAVRRIKGYTRPGETIYRVTELPEPAAPPDPATAGTATGDPAAASTTPVDANAQSAPQTAGR